MADTTTTIRRERTTPLDFDLCYPTLPSTHAWGKEEEENKEGLSIPVVDMEDPSAREVIGRACEEWGAFQLTGHGVPLKLLREVGVQSRRLFALPTSQKLKAIPSSSVAGSTGYCQSKISVFYPKQMWHEGFTIAGDVADHAAALWPHHHLHFCGVIEEYKKEMKKIAEKLFISIMEWLGVSPEETKDMCERDDDNGGGGLSSAVQLNSYPPCPEPEKAMGLAPHTDTTFITILHQVESTAGGLQVLHEGAGWVPVIPVADNSLVVNIGDLFHIISNGKLHPVLHRATVNKTMRRLSFAYFYFPSYLRTLSPSAKLLGGGVPRMYRDVDVEEYVRLKEKHFKKTLSFIRN